MSAIASEPSFFERFDRSSHRARRWRPLVLAVIGGALLLAAVVVWLARGDDPLPADVLLRQGLAAHAEGDLDEAAARYRAVLADDPDDAYAHYNLGLVAQTEGDAATAEEQYRAVIALDADFTPALFNLAVLRAEAADHRAAAELYRLVLAIDPDHAAAHLNLGFSLIALGEINDGRTEIGIAADLDPDLVGANGAIAGSTAPEGEDR